MALSVKTIERLSLYRRILEELLGKGVHYIYSGELAKYINGSSAQVRRDLMEIGFGGDSKKGYNVKRLITQIGKLMDRPRGENVAIIGFGNLGRALVGFLAGHNHRLKIVAAFDTDPDKAERVICGCRCHLMKKMKDLFSKKGIQVVMLAVPAEVAQETAEAAVAAGAVGILNFAPILLRLPGHVTVQNIDMMVELEKVAYVARQVSSSESLNDNENKDIRKNDRTERNPS